MSGKKYIQLITFIPLFLAATVGAVSPHQMETDPIYHITRPLEGELVILHTDRDIYIAGEDINFALYLLTQTQDIKVPSSKVAYLELVNSFNMVVCQYKAGIYNDFSQGVISVPDTIQSGEYQLRAYTREMIYNGRINYSSAPLSIYNPLKSTPQFTGASLVGTIPEPEVITEEIETILFKPRQKAVIDIAVDTTLFSSIETTNFSVSVAVSSGANRRPFCSEYISQSKLNAISDIAGKGSFSSGNQEAFGPFLTGSITATDSRLPGVNKLLYMTTPGKIEEFQYTYSDSNGNFRFLMPMLEGSKEIVIQTADGSKNWLIKLTSPFSAINDHLPKSFSSWSDDYIDKLETLGINHQINQIYKEFAAKIDTLTIAPTERKRFYGKPDISVLIDDYIALPTMEEVFDELVTGVTLKKNKGLFQFTMTYTVTEEKVSPPGLVLVDGIIVFDHNPIAFIDPDLIERIDVIRGEYQVGSVVFRGIISIITREGDASILGLHPGAMRTDYKNLDYSTVRESLEYNSSRPADSRIPDFRNTLYWNPTVKGNSNGIVRIEFHTSDFISDFELSMEGITDKGETYSVRKLIKVINE